MTTTELAAQLGISRQAASKLIARGMPRDSVGRAQSWRRRNTGSKVPKDISPDAALAELEAEGQELPADSASIEEQLALIAKVRRAAVRRYDEAIAGAEDDSARRWAQVLTSLSVRGADAEVKLRRAREMEKKTMSYEDAVHVFSGILKELKTYTDAMPSSLAGRVNPHDTEHARKTLVEWRDTFHRMIHAAGEKASPQP
jgi:hypothetical protein